MKQTILIIASFLLISCAPQTHKKFNLDFETYDSSLEFPKDWFEWGDYTLEADSVHVHSGEYASKITSKGNEDSFGCIAYNIPANYKGTSIKLEGYMKIKNVEEGFSGLMLRIDGNNEIMAFDNMEKQHIHGTKDWQKYSVTLPYPENAERIIVAGIMTGKGEAWFDDFIVTIDGQDIQTLKEKEILPDNAALDKEFDLDSKIEFPELTEEHISNLDLLGKVWGFLKYHHPEVGTGNYNWDYELFRILPRYLDAKNNNERDQVLLTWIQKYGEIETCSTCKEVMEDAVVKPDMAWFNEFDIQTALKNKLHEIYQNRFQGKHFYIGRAGAGNPKFLNENHYYSMSFDDGGFKLLSLYRYWNMIHYYFPHKNIADKNWNDVLKEFIPKFIHSKNKLGYELACMELISAINDTHATTIIGFNNVEKKKGTFYAPFKVQFIENQLVVTDYYNPELKDISKLDIGDVITHINGKPVAAILDSISPYYPASNDVAQRRDISKDLLRSRKENSTVTYISNTKESQHILPLYKKDDLNMKWYRWTDEPSYKLLDGNIGYVTLEYIKKEEIPIIKETFKNTKGIIIDIRNYPSTFVPYTLGSYFVSSPTSFVKIAKFNKDIPGEFTFTEPLKIRNGSEIYKGKLIILVNEVSQSQAEFTTMAFRAGNNTTVIGSTTAGADGSVSSIYLPGGLLTRISGNGMYYPDGTETQRIGIIPDIEITPTIDGIKNGKDELLEKAIEIIHKSE